ncbi:hypothetical protein [Salipaludibacillus aurantiacus]|uniref:Uncharacterized protein n=1 Tax=Salipaludibacillus aurantiacus TaxID=1601833 RepID=A0A1H9VTA5_9BACI|nr:hypothetical protein [Salipaludibacillus aurantiacus]SES24905.1 hypothetical protein SAMN05518684_11289 [Salipaludibacillus aurantiacus]
MKTYQDLIHLMKKHPELIESSIIFKKSFTTFTKKLTQLIYEDKEKKEWIVYFFYEGITASELGIFFEEMSKKIKDSNNFCFCLASPQIEDRHKKLLDNLDLRWIQLDERKIQHLTEKTQNSPALQNKEVKSEYSDALIVFGEGLFRADLNTSWHEFVLLAAGQEFPFMEEKEDSYKKRLFQIYYRHKLKYEGSLVLKYEDVPSDIKIPRYLTVYLDEINQGNSQPEHSEPIAGVDLQECLDWKKGLFVTEIPVTDEKVTEKDVQRMEVLLEKWGLQYNHSFFLNDYSSGDLEYFIQKLITVSMMIKAAKRKNPSFI